MTALLLTTLPEVSDTNLNFGSYYAQTAEGPDILTSGFEATFLALPVAKILPVSSFDRIYNIAYAQYGDVRYWFLILLYNGVADGRVLPSSLNLFGLDDLLYLAAQNNTYQAFLPTP